MSSLKKAVFNDCSKLLNHKYKWLPYQYLNEPYPPFKLPEDPTKDIINALNWKDIVKRESKGRDGGDCYYAVQFRDEGTNIYTTNINILKYCINNNIWSCNKPSEEEVKIAIERWEQLIKACHECRTMMNMLHRNNEIMNHI